jgi:hypothetical protein
MNPTPDFATDNAVSDLWFRRAPAMLHLRMFRSIMAAKESPMQESPSLIMVQFLTWVADRPRTREQAVEAWHSCPHISVWEDAVVDGLVHTENDGRRTIALTPRGRAVLKWAKADVH